MIAYHSLGTVRGWWSSAVCFSVGSDYMALADALAGGFEVHVMERRGPGSGPQRPNHSLDDECADLAAVTAATGSAAVSGTASAASSHSRRPGEQPIFDEVFVYEPGVPIRGQLRADWLDDYQRRLEHGDRRGAFAHMVKGAGFAPKPVAIMPVWYLRLVLRIAIRAQMGDDGPATRGQPC